MPCSSTKQPTSSKLHVLAEVAAEIEEEMKKKKEKKRLEKEKRRLEKEKRRLKKEKKRLDKENMRMEKEIDTTDWEEVVNEANEFAELCDAILDGRVDIARSLLDKSKDPSAVNFCMFEWPRKVPEGATNLYMPAVCLAAKKGHTEMVEFLVSRGAKY
jgi:ATP-dependent 26S proteasome regulatory subunit